jgi:hypothetical protein
LRHRGQLCSAHLLGERRKSFCRESGALLNIARASRYQSLNFVAISQTAGEQNENLKIGLPTLTFGPAQTPAQHQFVFASNSLESSVKGSFQSNPLTTSSFREGMLSPISSRTLALLLASFPREVLLHLLLDGFRLTSGNITDFYRNDPSHNALGSENDSSFCLEEFAEAGILPLGSKDWPIGSDASCNYTKFVRMLDLAIQRGVTAELIPSVKQSDKAPALSVGHLCFDIGLVAPAFKADTATERNLCGKPGVVGTDSTFSIGLSRNVRLDFVLRSPVGVYKALGKLLREGRSNQIRLKDTRYDNFTGVPFINVKVGSPDICVVSIVKDGTTYCVPQGNSEVTMMILDVLQELRNLNTSPSDLNTAFTVRLG